MKAFLSVIELTLDSQETSRTTVLTYDYAIMLKRTLLYFGINNIILLSKIAFGLVNKYNKIRLNK